MKNDKICKNCRFWEIGVNFPENYPYHNCIIGCCKNKEKIIEWCPWSGYPAPDLYNNEMVIEFEHNVDIIVCEDFGCIHWQPKENGGDEKA